MDDQTPSNEHGQWTIDDDGEVIRLEIAHMGPDGVEVFETNMPPEQALELSEAIAERARDLM